MSIPLSRAVEFISISKHKTSLAIFSLLLYFILFVSFYIPLSLSSKVINDAFTTRENLALLCVILTQHVPCYTLFSLFLTILPLSFLFFNVYFALLFFILLSNKFFYVYLHMFLFYLFISLLQIIKINVTNGLKT